MSVQLNWTALGPEKQGVVLKYLKIEPKPTFFDLKRKKWKKKPTNDTDVDTDKGKGVDFYRYDPVSDLIRIPYKFAELVIGYNNDKKIFNNNEYIFKSQLFDNQVDLYNDAWNHLIQNKAVNFCPFTSSGKTAMAIKMTADLSKFKNVGINLAIMTNTALLPQWSSSVKEFTTAIPYIVDSSKFNPPQGCNFLITTPGMCCHIPDLWKYNIGVLILDEAHTLCSASRVDALLAVQPKYVIACTATFERDDGMHAMIEAITGFDKIIKISKKPFNVYRINTGCDVQIPRNRFNDPDWNALVGLLCSDEYRNGLILDFVKMNAVHHKILVLTQRKEHVISLCKRTNEMGIRSDLMTGNKKKYNDSQVLYGTVKKLGTGFDEKAACQDFNGIRIGLLIICISIKSLACLEQVAGRAFRADFPNILYFIDDNPIMERHFEKGVKWFISRNGTIHDMNTLRYEENLKNKGQSVSHDVKKGPDIAMQQILQLKKEIENKK